MRFSILIALGFLYSSIVLAQSASFNDALIKTHVAYLCSDALAGRLTGSQGEKRAAQYIAAVFKQLGLEPAGDNGTFFQKFDFISGVSLGKNNLFSIAHTNGVRTHFKLGYDWRPLAFSDNTSFANTQLVFAGYGITAPTYDSYHGLNVKNKWVIVLRYMPEKISNEARRQLNQYATLRYKAFLAKKNGANGIIIVSGPNAKVKNELVSLTADTKLANAGIAAISVKDAVINDLLMLQKWQDKLDAGQFISFELSGIKITGRIDIQQKTRQGYNVIAKLKSKHIAAPMIVIGAHMDHLGQQKTIVKHIYYGADDNASGVASVLAAAAKLSHLQAQGKFHGNRDVLFTIWSGEELGLLGSTHFIKQFMEQTQNKSLRPTIYAYLNLDMVGRLRKSLVLQGVGSSSSWPGLIERANQHRLLPLMMQSDPYLPTDSTAFYLHGVPALNFFTGSHEEYHTPHDTLDKLNIDGMQKISAFLVDFILTLELEPNVLNYQQVQKSHTHTGRGFRVYLGTIPDYASTNLTGVKLAGVTKGSPAEQAGLKQDDVIVALAGKQIHDIYDYSFVLSALRAQQSVALTVLRGQSRVTLMIVPQSRE